MTFTFNNRRIETFSTDDSAASSARNLVIMHSVEGEGSNVWNECLELGVSDCTLATINDMDWDNELSPWAAPALFKKAPPFGGSADSYLSELMEQILPAIVGKLPKEPEHIYIAGYSMAGLFALYSAYNTNAFDGVVSASGSFWFPDFRGYTESHTISTSVKKAYFSVGDREAKTRNQVMQTVEDNTRKISDALAAQGIETTFELNEGGHFQDPDKRLAKGIAWMLK